MLFPGWNSKYPQTMLCVLCYVILTIFAFSEVSANDLDQQLLDAAGRGDLNSVKQLLDRGASSNARDSSQNTPLMYASWQGFIEIVDLLICHGADVNAFDEVGTTALCRAARYCREDIVDILLCAGADVNLKHISKYSPLGIAAAPAAMDGNTKRSCTRGNLNIIKKLVQWGADVNGKFGTYTHVSFAQMWAKSSDEVASGYYKKVLGIYGQADGGVRSASKRANGALERQKCPKLDCPNQCKLVVEEPDPDIVPAHPKHYSRISFHLKCPNIGSLGKEETKRKVTIKRKQFHGELVKTESGTNPNKDLELAVLPGEKTDVFYHWTGPKEMSSPKTETISFTAYLPRGKTEKSVNLSVGIDVTIDEIEPVRKGEGEICPFKEETFRVFVKDAFHPERSLAKLAERFKIKPSLKVDANGEVEDPFDIFDYQYGVMTPLAQEVLKRLYQEGTLASHRVVNACEGSGNLWSIKDYKGRSQLVCSDTNGSNRLSLVFCQKGVHKYHAQISADVDSRKDQPSGTPFQAEVQEYPYRAVAWFFHSVLPSLDVVGKMLPESAAVEAVRCCQDWWSLAGSKFTSMQDALISVTKNSVSCFTRVATDPEVAKTLGFKSLLKVLQKLFLVAGLITGAMDEFWTPCTQMDYERISCSTSKAMTGKAIRGDIPNTDPNIMLNLAQAVVQGLGAKHVTVLKKEGLTRYELLKGHKKSQAIESGMSPQDAMEVARAVSETMMEGKRSVTVPALTSHTRTLLLEGDGSTGSLIVITADSILKYAYPEKPWKSTVQIDGKGAVKFIKGDKLTVVK